MVKELNCDFKNYEFKSHYPPYSRDSKLLKFLWMKKNND